MGWLKKAGIVLLKVTEILTGFGPVVSALIPGTTDDKIIQVTTHELSQVAAIVTQVEAMAAALTTPLPGPEKLKMATPAVAQIILQSSMMAHHKIANPDLFKQGCASVASGIADILNSLKDDVDVENKKD
jgi:hypothetical protein